VFQGRIAGKKNTIPGREDPEGNRSGSLCPGQLLFLTTEEGGELDWRQ